MSDRKYRQHGYQDAPRVSETKRHDEGKTKSRAPGSREPQKPNMLGFRDVIRCARCGHKLNTLIEFKTRCSKCQAYLHSCAQCSWFDAGSRFECSQPIPARISPKDRQNDCDVFDVRVTVERETSSTGPSNPKEAFNALFD